MLLPVIGSSILGGIIGYITNWVAIKMLFRPLEEKRLFGWHVPFTPGLIPKQRGRLAASIGDAVGNYLLTTEALLGPISKPGFEHDVEDFISHALQKLGSNRETIDELLERHNLRFVADALQEQARRKVTVLLADDSVQDLLLDALQPLVKYLSDTTLAEMLTDQNAEQRQLVLREVLLGVLQDAQVMESLRMLVDRYSTEIYQSNSTLRELIPDKTLLSLKGTIADAGPGLLRRLEERLQSEENRQAVKKVVKGFLSSSTMLRIASAFIDADRVIDSLIASLQREETRALILQQVLDWLDKVLDMPLSRLTRHVNRQALLDLADLLMDRLLNDNLADNLAELVENWFVSNRESRLGDLATAKLEDRSLSALGTWGRLAIKRALGSSQMAMTIDQLATRAYRHLLSSKPGPILGRVTLGQVAGIKITTINLIREFADRYGARILEAVRLPRLVEQQVNRLDVLQVEDILLKVMDNQLRAITNLGLLLGAIIGIIMPFLNLWLMSLGN